MCRCWNLNSIYNPTETLCSEMDHAHLGFEGLHFLKVQILQSPKA